MYSLSGIETILSIIIFIIIEGVAILVLWEFIKSDDGTLRRLMIGYFAVEIWVQAVFYWKFGITGKADAIEYYLLAAIPKAGIKILLFLYLRSLNDRNL